MNRAWFGWSSVLTLAASGIACRADMTTVTADRCTSLVVAVSPSAPDLLVRDSVVLTASYSPAANSCTPPVPVSALRWASSDSAIASIDSIRGVVIAVRPGTVAITLHAPDGTRILNGAVPLSVYAPLFNRIIFMQIPDTTTLTSDMGASLWSMAPDGSDRTRLIDSLGYPYGPRVSPDGGTVVFGDEYTLYLVDAGGRNKRALPNQLPVSVEPSWSPDGRWILFSGAPSSAAGHDTTQLYVIHPDGSGRRALTAPALNAHDATWSPDGAEILFMRTSVDSNGAPYVQALIMDSSGANPHVVRNWAPYVGASQPAWSPDGGAVLFLGPGPVGDFGIWRLRVDDSSYVMLGAAHLNRGEWSPDGKFIVYGAGDLWVMNADGSNQHQLLSDSLTNTEASDASWTPAGPAPTSRALTQPRRR